MDLELNEEQRMIRTAMQDFAKKEVAPVARDSNGYERFPTDIVKKTRGDGISGA